MRRVFEGLSPDCRPARGSNPESDAQQAWVEEDSDEL
jgi:hypothetical protein